MLVVYLWQRCCQFFVLIITNEKCIYNEYVYNPSHQKSKPLLPSLYALLKGGTNKNKNNIRAESNTAFLAKTPTPRESNTAFWNIFKEVTKERNQGKILKLMTNQNDPLIS